MIDHLDPKYLTDYEKEEIKLFKSVYYIGHKAFQRKVINILKLSTLKTNLMTLKEIINH